MVDRPTGLLDLPLEIRLQIYRLGLKPSRLCTRAILDSEWVFARDRCSQVAPLIFTSKKIYDEAAPIYYSKATLEITSCQRDPTDGRTLAEFAQQYEHDHAFCPAGFLQAIENVHVYSDQEWPIDQDSFHALFQWLVSRTGVKQIYLSRKTMQQGRHIPDLVCLDNAIYDVTKQAHDKRLIDIYARNVSSRLRYLGGSSSSNRSTRRPKPLPDIQLYLESPNSTEPQICRQPQWSLLSASHEAGQNKEDLLKQEMERFALRELRDAYLRQAHIDGYLWLYQTIQIQRRNDDASQGKIARSTNTSALQC